VSSKPDLRRVLGRPKLPARMGAVVVPLLLSIFMTCIVSVISTLRSIGIPDGFIEIWLQAWGLSWVVAFPTLLVALPAVRRLARMVVEDA
jgi:hypothetical protein